MISPGFSAVCQQVPVRVFSPTDFAPKEMILDQKLDFVVVSFLEQLKNRFMCF
ncbi:hypothetical protein Spb1_11310 [Planctopirus ephydatiae]|uniref:Uncharacterized protein n=1 Tax=Planctopirus ephydatiae TaxID=2528019 RepID=A0A518GLC4_9PLAN|nr:hypothetical protein Spb1_11310 [Planctopirus ephydatiae]